MNMKIQFSRIFVLTALTILLVVPVFVFTASYSHAAQNIVDGDLVTVSQNPDIYIVKIIGVKKFKRLILNPDIFNSYGHLKWSNVKTIDQATLDLYKLSELVIEINPDGSVADPKVYRVISSGNSDVGERSWLNLTVSEFEAAGYDWDSLYHVNHKEALPSFYPTKTPLTYQDVLSIRATIVPAATVAPIITTPPTQNIETPSQRYLTTEGGAVYDTVLKKFISSASMSLSTTTQTIFPVTQPVITTIPTITPTPSQPIAPKITVSVSSDNPVGKNIIKGEKGITVLKLDIENVGGSNVQINNLKIRLVGASFSNLQDLKIKIGGQLYSAVYTNGDIKTYNPGYTLNPNVPIQVLVQADVALTANSDSFNVDIIEVSGVNTTSGEGAKTPDVVTGNTFTIYQPATNNASPAISTATDISFLTNTDDVGTAIRFEAKNNPFSVLKIILTFSGVNESDINNVKLLIGGNAWYKLYPTATNSATGQKVAYIEGNKIIFQNFSPYELFHVNRNEVLDLVVLFEMKPTAFWKTLQVDIPNPLTDITAFDYETGLILSVGGSSIGNSMTITNKKYYSGY